jgi:hypothetical protein
VLKTILAGLAILLVGGFANAADKPSAAQAIAAMERAGAYFRDRLGIDGTYVWQYSVDGKVRRGEGGAINNSTGWVQPPGTPAVGAAFLRIYEVSGDKQWLEAAHMVARALVRTQLVSGGWSKSIETDPGEMSQWCYRSGRSKGDSCEENKNNPSFNRTQLDDNNTQSVLNFLMWFDKASTARDPKVRESIEFALRRLMKVQYSNGAFPSSFSEKAPGADQDTASRASIPANWPRDWVKPERPPYFVINDHLLRDTGRLFLNAYHTYHRPNYLRTAMKIGDFLVAAQLPPPQQGWAQMYNHMLQPVWGRKFEPPSVASSETAGNIEYLIELHQETSKVQYLETAKTAANWLKASRLPDGTWARFYELNSDRPLYVDNNYKVTYDDRDLLSHYRMKGAFNIQPLLDRMTLHDTEKVASGSGFWVNSADDLEEHEVEAEAQRLIGSQDAEGRWIEGDWIEGQKFIDAVFILARFASMPGQTE